MTDTDRLAAARLDDDEQKALDAILAAGDAVLALGLKSNRTEFFMHIHGLQGFVVQRMLARLNTDKWSDWYSDD